MDVLRVPHGPAVARFPRGALTLVLFDWQGHGVAKPLWAFGLPTVSGIVGGLAGFRAQKEVLGALAVAFGLLCVPAAIVVVGLLYGH